MKRFVRRVRHATAQRQRPGKARQASKLAEIRAALIAGGFDTVAKQAVVLGLGRSTAWAFLNRDESTGATAKVFKRIFSSPNLPVAVRRKIEEYVKEKSSGLYGHSERQSEAFRDTVPTLIVSHRKDACKTTLSKLLASGERQQTP